MNGAYKGVTRPEAAEAWRRLLLHAGWFETREAEAVEADAALGRVTSADVLSARPVPHYECAAMDGFAVRSADAAGATSLRAVSLRICATGAALTTGCAIPVNTGDALPAGADSVVMKEHAAVRDGRIELQTEVPSGRHVRRTGEDLSAGGLVIPAGQPVRPSDIAAALATGNNRLQVWRRPRVTVIPTGDEIVDSGEELAPGQIRDINSPMLAALLTEWGASARRNPVVPDDPQALRTTIVRALRDSDLVVTNAGTSGGSEDFTASVLEGIGQVCCHGVAIRPGRPVLLAVAEGKPVIGLPGYPVSCMLTAELFLRDLVYEFQRKEPPPRRIVKARLVQEIRSVPEMEEFLRVSLSNGAPYAAASVPSRGASLLSALVHTQGWLRIPADCTRLEPGTVVEVECY